MADHRLCLAASGTAGYRAPELTNGIEASYKACDVYSLGRTMLHLLTFNKPFPGSSTEHELETLRVRACLPALHAWPCGGGTGMLSPFQGTRPAAFSLQPPA